MNSLFQSNEIESTIGLEGFLTEKWEYFSCYCSIPKPIQFMSDFHASLWSVIMASILVVLSTKQPSFPRWECWVFVEPIVVHYRKQQNREYAKQIINIETCFHRKEEKEAIGEGGGTAIDQIPNQLDSRNSRARAKSVSVLYHLEVYLLVVLRVK